MNTQPLEESIRRYFLAWNQTGLDAISATLQSSCVSSGIYTDPQNAPTGIEGLAAIIQHSQEAAPGRIVTLTSRIDFHHGSGRYTWVLTKPNGDKSQGMDYVEYDADNRITRVVSFFGELA